MQARRIGFGALRAAIAALALLGPAATADAATFSPSADAGARSDRPTENFGASALRVDAAPVQRAFLRFDVSGLEGPVSGATLRVFAGSGTPDGYSVRSVASATGWTESGLTWNDQPGLGATLGSSGAVTAGTWTSVDVTPSVTGDGTVELALTSDSTTSLRLLSRESLFAPQLVVDTSPGPGPEPTPGPTPEPTPGPTPEPTPGPTSDPVVAAAGDIACDPGSSGFQGGLGSGDSCRQLATSDLLSGADHVLALGDLQYEDGALAKFERSYDVSWGRFKAITSPAVGNHEYLTPGAAGYFDYWGDAAGPRGTGWYSFDLGAWHLISLDSTDIATATTFLDQDLAARDNRCILAFWHHPRFSSSSAHGNNPAIAPFWDRLYAAGADVVLNGHAHVYERFGPQTPSAQPSPTGIREFVVGTGGKALHGFGTVKANSEVRIGGKFGVLRMTLHPNSYEWRYQGEDYATYDSGSGNCS